MEIKTFRLPLLNMITTDREVQGILNQQEKGKKLDFVRGAILSFATEQGYSVPSSNRPIYVPPNKWRKVQEAEAKKRDVDYSYVTAYYWLKSLPKFSYRQKSDIIREAIKNHSATELTL